MATLRFYHIMLWILSQTLLKYSNILDHVQCYVRQILETSSLTLKICLKAFSYLDCVRVPHKLKG